jgi:hypothetical protein
MSQIENQQRTTRRAGCSRVPSSAHRRGPVAVGRDIRDIRELPDPRRARSEARAAEGVINAYARGVATARAPRQVA